jgi:hypothetical protein
MLFRFISGFTGLIMATYPYMKTLKFGCRADKRVINTKGIGAQRCQYSTLEMQFLRPGIKTCSSTILFTRKRFSPNNYQNLFFFSK